MKERARAVLIFAAGLFVSSGALASVEVSVTAREENSMDLEGDWEVDDVNLGYLDCLEDVEVTLTVSVSGEDTSGRELYLFSGDDCDDPDEESDECDEEVLEYDSDTVTIDVPVSWLLDDSDCSGDVGTGLWVGLLESEGEKEDDATWADRIDVDLEISVPDAPDDVTVGVGENNLLVGWERLDEDVAGYLAVYAAATGEETDGGGGCEGPLGEGMEVDGAMEWEEVSASASDVRIRGLENGTRYQVAAVTVDENGNPSLLSEVLCATPEETEDFFEAYSDAGGSGGEEYCFIATAAFHDYDHPTVRALRRFRDGVLYRIPGGALVVGAYYRIGPRAAQVVGDDERVAGALRLCLTCLAGLVACVGDVGPSILLAGLLLAVLAGIGLGARLPVGSATGFHNASRR